MLVGMLNWLQQCTCPDISTIFSLLASHMHCPSPGHIDAVRYVGRYLLSTLDLGLIISTCANASLESYIYFPLPATSTSSNIPSLIMFCDADWGPQDTSQKIVVQCLLMSLDLSVVIFSFMVVALFSGKHTRRLMSFALHVRQKLRIWLIYIYVLLVQSQFTMTIKVLLIGLILSVLRVCVISISDRMLFVKQSGYKRFLFDIFTKEFKSDCIFCSVRALLFFSIICVLGSLLVWGVLGYF
jgi:hypothetical protein